MVIKQAIFWVFCFCSVGSISEIYVVEDPDCTVDENVMITPCYSLKQLVNNSEILLSTGSSTLILFLPGTHVVPENQTFVISNFIHLEMRPWRAEQKVAIECQKQPIVFEGISILKIISLNLTSCSLKYLMTNENLTRVDDENSVLFVGCVFENSKQDYAIFINGTNSELTCNISNCLFSSNYGAISVKNWFGNNGYVHLIIADTMFLRNKPCLSVQGIYVFLSNSQFINNSATLGGAILSNQSTLFLNNVTFHKNHASEDGGSVYASNVSVIEISGCHFMDSFAGLSGGAILMKIGVSVTIDNTLFEENSANKSGGVIFGLTAVIMNCSSCLFRNNTAISGKGGAIYFGAVGVMIFKHSIFEFNKAIDGGAIYATYDKTNPLSYVFITIRGGYALSNSAIDGSGGFAYMIKTRLNFHDSNYIINGNTASVGGGAICAVDSDIGITNTMLTVANNTAQSYGGALWLTNSLLDLNQPAGIRFDSNAVTSTVGKGGGIFVPNTDCEKKPYSNFLCFIKIDDAFNLYNQYNIKMIFLDNKASQGSILHGGLLDRCILDVSNSKSLLGGIEGFKHFSQYVNTSLAISSDPIRVCLCSTTEYRPDCSVREIWVTAMRGKMITLMGCVVDQDRHPLQSTISASYIESLGVLDKGEERIKVGTTCTKISYHILTQSTLTTLLLQPEGSCGHSEFSSFKIHIKIVPCSIGFETDINRCVCERRLIKYNIAVCNVASESIEKTGPIWLRYDEQYLKVHTSCPLDYCQVTSKSISLLSPDEQCANNRAGVICGACKENYSIALGSSKCLRCTSNYTPLWLTLVLAVAGVALVAFLLVLNMTISSGTLNGLIFYANVVSISGLTSLHNCSIHPILSIFIAWANLDLGVETCFYPGMDTYQKTWLQFAFPVYVWLLVAAIIVASHYSSKAMKVFGRNNVAILATLFLLSYTKILKTITTALTFTEVFQSDALNVSAQILSYRAWMYDGNLDYLKGKHVVLFSVALIFLVVLFLPYTLLLIFGQCVRSIPVRRRCVHRIINSTAFVSIMDAYHAPYNDRHRYWTGLMLLTRCVLFLAFATVSNYDRTVVANMFVTNLILIGILTVKVFTTNTYKMIFMNVLEIAFFLNLMVLAATIILLKENDDHNKTCHLISASISICVIMFMGMVTYHACLRVRKTRYCKDIKALQFLTKLGINYRRYTANISRKRVERSLKTLPTKKGVELREVLLTNDS